jgi:hypothetical protein
MGLERWVEYGWLRREPTSPSEIEGLLGIVESSLADASVEAVSTDLRFIAASTWRFASLRLRSASGHRTATQAGHQVKTIEPLELTIKASPKPIQRFKTFNNKRNKSVYDVAGAISDQELEAMMKLANELKDSTVAWLQEFHQEGLMNRAVRSGHSSRRRSGSSILPRSTCAPEAVNFLAEASERARPVS